MAWSGCSAWRSIRRSRRAGVGMTLARALLAGSAANVAYLQVEEANAPAVGLYARLGFGEAYRYCHRVAPALGAS